ncbi:MAG: TIGR00725 family protein [Nocardioides sp.]
MSPYVAVVGPGDPRDPTVLDLARQAGRLLAARGWTVVTGGLGGLMAAAAAGVAESDGTAVALLPGTDRSAASPGHTVVIPTGLGEMRNALIVRTADAVLAIGGSWGTLSEVALAARTGVPVFAVAGWDLGGLPAGEGVVPVTACDSVADAVARIAEVLG